MDLDAVNSIHHHECAIRTLKTRLGIRDKIRITRCINKGDTMFVPDALMKSRTDGHAALDLLGVKIQDGISIIDTAQFRSYP